MKHIERGDLRLAFLDVDENIQKIKKKRGIIHPFSIVKGPRGRRTISRVPKSSILCPNWTHLYTVSLWEIHANFHIIAFFSKTRR